MSAKYKHLDFIQAVINRMAGNSFLLKGWSVTLTVAIFALASSQDSKTFLVFISLLPTVMFWGLDGFFLLQERLFRALYDNVRQLSEEEIDFSMDTSPFRESVASWFEVLRSKTLLAFHLTIIAIIVIVFVGILVFK
jgi:hypothetical protein